MRVFSRTLLVGLLVLLVTVTGRAAGVAVQGAVVDPTGLPIPGATVELLSGTRLTARAVSGYDGVFRFADVAVGTYDIRVTMAGFRRAVTTIRVGTAAPRLLRLTLLVGSINETVRVGEGAPSMPSAKPGEAPPPPPAAPTAVSRDALGMLPGGVAGGVAATGAGRGGYAGGSHPYTLNSFASDTESYAGIDENKFRRPVDQPLSTFSIDVDTASYANVRRFLNEGRLPPADAVRVEELINYFKFDYADSTQAAPFGITTELAPCPSGSRPGGCRRGRRRRAISCSCSTCRARWRRPTGCRWSRPR
jgi:Ca-activated chloride channel family protein